MDVVQISFVFGQLVFVMKMSILQENEASSIVVGAAQSGKETVARAQNQTRRTTSRSRSGLTLT